MLPARSRSGCSGSCLQAVCCAPQLNPTDTVIITVPGTSDQFNLMTSSTMQHAQCSMLGGLELFIGCPPPQPLARKKPW